VLGGSGPAYAGWLDARQPEFRAQIKSAALDPFRGYANALRDSLSDAVQVLDAFYDDLLVMPTWGRHGFATSADTVVRSA
jgi:hypothetical protein